MIKRKIDVVESLVGLILILSVLVIIALLIRYKLSTPVLFR